jgi:hypothetical protein
MVANLTVFYMVFVGQAILYVSLYKQTPNRHQRRGFLGERVEIRAIGAAELESRGSGFCLRHSMSSPNCACRVCQSGER